MTTAPDHLLDPPRPVAPHADALDQPSGVVGDPQESANGSLSTRPRRRWPDYRAVWRWHFYASLFCGPLVILLAVTGSIYLFKPQIESWVDRPYGSLMIQGATAPASEQVRAVLDRFPGAQPIVYQLPSAPDGAPSVLVRDAGQVRRVFVHPQTLAVLGERGQEVELIQFVKRLHGQLALGPRGSYVVELAACWTVVMILTGLYLWWPSSAKGLGGVVYPRFAKGRGVLWRDLHSVVGVWVSVLALFLILTGLPWAQFWGNYFRGARAAAGLASTSQDWTIGGRPATGQGGGEETGDHGEHAHHHGEHADHTGVSSADVNAMTNAMTDATTDAMTDATTDGALDAALAAELDVVVARTVPMGLAHPVTIAIPERGESAWVVKSESQNRPLRTTVRIDGQSGEIVARQAFADRPLLDRAVSFGIAAHEGQLFGWPNQLLALATTIGLVTLSLSGYVLWWRRRDAGTLGAPRPLATPAFSGGLVAAIVALAVCLPLFGVSLLVVLASERWLLSRVPPLRDWLGLRVSSV